MKSIIILHLIAATFASRADVIVFNMTSTNRVIGLGQTQTTVANGRMVVDAETGTNVAIGWFAFNGQNYFGIDRRQAYMNTVTAAGGVTHTVVAYGTMGTGTNGFYRVREGYARGKNVSLPIRPTRSVNFPTTFTLTSRGIQDGPNGAAAGEETGVARFNLLATQNANAANESVEAVIARFGNNLRAQGYVEVFIPE